VAATVAGQDKETPVMPWKPNTTAAHFGISAKELAEATKDAMVTGGARQHVARHTAAKAHKAAVAGGAKRR
jgi:hypothetical protein